MPPIAPTRPAGPPRSARTEPHGTGPTPPAKTSSATPAAPAPTAIDAIGQEQIQALKAAKWDGRIVFRAASVATMSAWSLLIFGGLSVLFGIFSLVSFLLGLVLLAFGWIELRGARGIRQFRPASLRHLTWNQLGLIGLAVIYSSYRIISTITSASPYEAYRDGPGAEMIATMERLHVFGSIVFFSIVIVVSALACGGTALYYWTRQRHVSEFLVRTPDWAVETLRAAS